MPNATLYAAQEDWAGDFRWIRLPVPDVSTPDVSTKAALAEVMAELKKLRREINQLKKEKRTESDR